MDATAGLLAGFPVAAQSAVLPLPPRNGEQVTIEEYAEEMISCTVPDRVVQLWKDFGTCYPEAEQVATLHQMPGVSKKLLWAIKHQTAKEPTKTPKSNYSGGRIKVGDSVVWCPQDDIRIKCVEKYGPISHVVGKTWIVSDVIGPHPTNQRKQFVSIKLEGYEKTCEYHENFFKVVGWDADKDWDYYPTLPEKVEQ